MDELKRKNAELKALFEISKVLGSSFDVEKNLQTSMEILSDVLEMRRGTVTLLDTKTGTLKIVVAHGLTHEQIRRGVYKIGEGVVRKVMETGAPMIVPDLEKEPRFLTELEPGRRRKTSLFCVYPSR